MKMLRPRIGRSIFICEKSLKVKQQSRITHIEIISEVI